MRMKVIYIAGRYRDPRGEFYVEANRREAARAALTVWMNGGVALCLKYLEGQDAETKA